MKTNSYVFALILTLFLTACQTEKEKNTVEGLWLVESVEVGERSQTPIARWTRFNADGTQISGNGWFQHSIGTWTLKDNQLSVNSDNGIEDQSEAFTISLENDQMTWKRNEEGQEVMVHLKRINILPASKGNKLMGLWKLTKSTDDGNDITVMSNPESKAMLHLRWDNMYVQHNMPKGKQYGIYKIHGHKPEIQLVNYGDYPQFSYWEFSVSDKKLTLISTDSTSVMEFERIHQFIE